MSVLVSLMYKKTIFRKICVLMLFFSSGVYALNGGAYNSSPGKRMDLSSVNHWFDYEFPVTDEPPPRAVITKIYYQYALAQSDVRPGKLFVKLCSEETSRCVDISDSQSGEISLFSGESAVSHFTLYYQVVNHNALGFITGNGTTQLTVNWTLP